MTKPTMFFKQNGRTHVALLMAKFFRGWFTTKDLRSITNVFDDIKMTSQSLHLLRKKGLLEKQESNWRITPLGIQFLYATARHNKLANLED